MPIKSSTNDDPLNSCSPKSQWDSMSQDQQLLLSDDASSQKHLILPTDLSVARLRPYLDYKFRWSHLFLILSICLIISALVLLWSDQEFNVINFYDYQFTKQAAPSFVGYNENGSVKEVLKQTIKSTTTTPIQLLTQKPFIPGNRTKYDKYLLTNVGGGACGGVGNVIFRIASLYGIGKELKRNACLQGSCSEEYHIELYAMFPHLQDFPLLRDCWDHSSKGIGFAGNCWNYENTSRLHQYDNETFINLHTSYLQSHKFFHPIRDEILYMFDFSDPMKGIVEDYTKQMFDNDNSTKICAHMRQGDFNGGHPLLPSTEVFTVNALNYLVNKALNKSIEHIGILLFSDDIWFANGIVKQLKESHPKQKAFVTQQLNRLENIALAARHCDYFLITSAGSTFGWWMAYLMPNEKQKNVYYNSLFFKKGNEGSAKGFHEEDFFPSEWNRLILNPENTEIEVQDRSIPATTV